MAGGWYGVYQFVLVARFLDRTLFEKALLKIEARDGEEKEGCAKMALRTAKLSCAANRAAEYASSLTLFDAAAVLRRDAVAYAELGATQEPEALFDALIGLASDELAHGRFTGAEDALDRANRVIEADDRSIKAARQFTMNVIRARLADARLDADTASTAFRDATDALFNKESETRFAMMSGSLGQQLGDLVESHFRGQFCSTCGNPVAAPVKEWVGKLLGGGMDNDGYDAPHHEYLLMALSAPAGTFTQSELRSYARRYIKKITSSNIYVSNNLHILSTGSDEINTARYLAISSIFGSYHNTKETFNIFREKDSRKQVASFLSILKGGIADNYDQFGKDSDVASHLDNVSRSFQASGHRNLARATLQFMVNREPSNGGNLRAEKQTFASIYVPAFARLASLDYAAGDERAANGNLTQASEIAATKLREEWSRGGAGAILALRDLAPALRLIAQKRSEIVTARGVSRNAASHETLFRAMQAAMFGETALALAVADLRRVLTDSALRDLQQRHRDASAEAERITAIAGYGFESGDVEGTLARAHKEAVDRRDRLGREMSGKMPPAFTSVADIEPAPLSETRARLRDGEALTLLHVGSHGIHGFLVDRTGQSIAWRTTIKREAVEQLVRSVRAGGDVSQGPFPPFPYADASKLHEAIFGPIREHLGRYGRLVIVGDGPLQAMPYGILLSQPIETPPSTREALRVAALPWLIRSHAIALSPSVRSFIAQRDGTFASQAGKPFLGIGDPKLSDANGAIRSIDIARAFGSSSSGLADVSMLRRLVSLPETADELRTIAKLLDAPEEGLLLRERANETAIRGMRLSDFKVVAFATHGVLAGQVTGSREPGLVLSPPEMASRLDDGFLALSEIADLRFDADLVMLSACNTGASDGRPRAEGLSGLARGFFSAGARSLLVTHWEIPSESSVKVTTGLIAERSRHPQSDWADAHRAATLRVIDAEGPAEWAHPAYWGGFAVVGVMPAR